jgi:hypothetical protein
MVLPKEKVMHKDLSTAYVSLDHLIKDLGEEGFSGYVKLENPFFTGAVFLERGKISGASAEPSSSDPLTAIFEESAKEGVVNVYALSDEVVYILVTTAYAKKTVSEVPMDIVNWDHLIAKLSREASTGVAELADQGNILRVLFFEGKPVEYLYEGEEGTLQGGEAEDRLPRFLDSQTANLSIYASDKRIEELEFDVLGVRDEIRTFFSFLAEGVEKSLGAGKFDRLFREVSLALAEEHDFLDPFASQVRYGDSGLEIDEGLSLVKMLEGLKDLVRQMMSVLKESGEPKVFPSLIPALDERFGDRLFVRSLVEVINEGL